jgi:hypothetical protein
MTPDPLSLLAQQEEWAEESFFKLAALLETLTNDTKPKADEKNEEPS